MLKTKDILQFLNAIAPFDLAEDWDNCGLQAGNLNWDVNKIMIGLDVSLELMKAAQKNNCDLVLTHHPLMIQPEKSFDFSQMPGNVIEIAARQRISVVSVHTNLDKAADGLNDYFARKIGLAETTVFCTDAQVSALSDIAIGMGRIGTLKPRTSLGQLVLQIKERLHLSHLRVTGEMDLPVTRAAICTGSGGSLLDEFLNSGADVYITGDMKYHDARRVEEASKALVDVGHFGSEHMAVELLFDKLKRAVETAGCTIEIEQFNQEKDPFTIV